MCHLLAYGHVSILYCNKIQPRVLDGRIETVLLYNAVKLNLEL